MILTIIGFAVIAGLAMCASVAAISFLTVSRTFDGVLPLAIVLGIASVALWTFAWWVSPFSITVVLP